MNATILCVGKLKEPFLREGCAEYLKRLARYGKYEITQVADFPEEADSPVLAARVKDRSLIEGGDPRYCKGGECRDQVLLDNLDGWIGSYFCDAQPVLAEAFARCKMG